MLGQAYSTGGGFTASATTPCSSGTIIRSSNKSSIISPAMITVLCKFHSIESKNDWPVLPASVKFDPTDQELIEYLEDKVSAESARSHPLIDLFIPTINNEHGICYTHPEKLPGETPIGCITL
uniref:NAC domain-containing protein n=1 Tax=Aegilops tauschii subsp. strangulata TaxID=200361 RepID=A0A452XBV5_AEGTS